MILTTAMIALCMTACGADSSSGQEAGETESRSETETEADETASSQSTGDSNILIAYFSMPEDIDKDGIDADAGASIVVKDGQVMGNLEYMAGVIQQTIGGDLLCIETVEEYPLDHDPLVDQASEEQSEEARPELATQIENLGQYDTILLGYPNWWGDMPMILRSL